MCCMMENTQTPETCTTESLCKNYENTVLARGTCTDPTWKDPACLDLCLSGESMLFFLCFVGENNGSDD